MNLICERCGAQRLRESTTFKRPSLTEANCYETLDLCGKCLANFAEILLNAHPCETHAEWFARARKKPEP